MGPVVCMYMKPDDENSLERSRAAFVRLRRQSKEKPRVREFDEQRRWSASFRAECVITGMFHLLSHVYEICVLTTIQNAHAVSST